MTTDGTPAATGSTSTSDSAYRSPTITDSGTILTDKGGEIVELNENGTVIRHAEPATRAYPPESAISPDGAHVAYNYSEITQWTTYEGSCGYYPQPGAAVENADGTGSQDAGGNRATEEGQWIGDTTVALDTDTSYVDYFTLGGSEQDWFVPGDAFPLGGTSIYDNDGVTVSRAVICSRSWRDRRRRTATRARTSYWSCGRSTGRPQPRRPRCAPTRRLTRVASSVQRSRRTTRPCCGPTQPGWRR